MIEYRAYQPQDLAAVMGLFREPVHSVCCGDYSPEELGAKKIEVHASRMAKGFFLHRG